MPFELEEISLGNIKVDIQKVYPELEDLEVTPTREEQKFKSSKYGYNEVTVKGVDLKEDLNTELTEQDNLLTTQETTIDTILEVLKNKADITLQEKNVTPSATQQEVIADNEYQGLSKVTVNPIPIKISNASYLFYGGAKFEYYDLFIALCKDVVNTNSMFYGCTTLKELDLSGFDDNGLYNMASMFNGCSNLRKVDLKGWNTIGVTNMSSLFNNCSKLTEIDISSFDTSNLTSCAQMFNGCKALVNLDLSHFDFGKVNSIITMFGNCTNLTNFKSPKNVGMAFTQKSNNYTSYQMSYSSSTKLTYESLMDIINNLYDLNLVHNTANGGTLYTQKLTLGATNKAKLTAEEISIATKKGYTVA